MSTPALLAPDALDSQHYLNAIKFNKPGICAKGNEAAFVAAGAGNIWQEKGFQDPCIRILVLVGRKI